MIFMGLEQLQEFYKGRTAKGEPPTRDDPYAAVRHVLNIIHPEWEGDLGPTGQAPPWGMGPYAKFPQGPGAVATDALMDKAVVILNEDGFSDKAFAKISQLFQRGEGEQQEKFMELSKISLQKISPNLARFLASAAGWAMSDDVVRAGGGVPRGQGEASPEWERALRQQEMREDARQRQREREEERRLTAAERRKQERSMRNAMRTRKSMDEYPQFDKIHNFWSEKSDEYHRNRPIHDGLDLIKDRAPVPPRQGLIWDGVKHRWVRPENHGHSVSEVQGGKRIRGVGTGVHERSVGGHGKGPTRLAEAGRRFRGVADAGVVRPHEREHPAFRGTKKKRGRKTKK